MKKILTLLLAFSVICLPMEARRRWVPVIAAAGANPAFGAENMRSGEIASGATSAVTVGAGGIALGKTAVLFISWESASQTLTSVTSTGNTWTVVGPGQINGDGNMAIAWCKVSTVLNAADTITINWGSAAFTYRFWMLAYADNTGATPLDSSNSGSSPFNTAVTAPTVTTTAANTIAFQGMSFSTGTTYSGGTWTLIGGAQDQTGSYQTYYAYKVFSSTQAGVTPDGTLSANQSVAGANVALK